MFGIIPASKKELLLFIGKNWYINIKKYRFFLEEKSIFMANESMRFMGHPAWEFQMPHKSQTFRSAKCPSLLFKLVSVYFFSNIVSTTD